MALSSVAINEARVVWCLLRSMGNPWTHSGSARMRSAEHVRTIADGDVREPGIARGKVCNQELIASHPHAVGTIDAGDSHIDATAKLGLGRHDSAVEDLRAVNVPNDAPVAQGRRRGRLCQITCVVG